MQEINIDNAIDRALPYLVTLAARKIGRSEVLLLSVYATYQEILVFSSGRRR
jgi:hypothetical protein